MVTPEPASLPNLATWYLTTNLPAPASTRKTEEALAAASVAEVVRLCGLRMWVEQSYEQVEHALGWSDYQVRSDRAIRRHWHLACVAFSFCWWAYVRLPASLNDPTEHQEDGSTRRLVEKRRKGKSRYPGRGLESGKGAAGTLCDAMALLEGVYRFRPAGGARSAA